MSARTVTAKLFGGPLDGLTMPVENTVEKIVFGPKCAPFWTYTFAGRDAGITLFAKQPTQRKVRRFIMWYIGKHGKSPLVEAQFAKPTPFRYAEGRKVARAKARAARKGAA